MKLLLALLIGAASAHAGDMAQSNAGASPTYSTVTITGAGTACLTAGDLSINCDSGSVTVGGHFGVAGGTTTLFYNGDNQVNIKGGATGSQATLVYTTGGTARWYAGTNNFVAGELYEIGRPGASAALTIDRSDNVGFGSFGPASRLHVSSGTIRIDGTGAPTTGGALCLNAGGAMAKCTSAIDASGNCTCP